MKYSINTSLFTTLLILVLFTFMPNYAAAQSVPIEVGTDVSLADNSGYLRLGPTTSINLVLDQNEVQARNNGSASTLFINNEGGNVAMQDFTRLGEGAPYIKTKLIEGLETFQVLIIPHGLTAANILSIDLITFGPEGDLVWRVNNNFFFNNTNIIIDNGIPAEASYKVFITYRQ